MSALGDALSALYARVPLGMRLGLSAMHDACARFGHPERGLTAVHVGGTNGKGSVCAMVESIARAEGLSTGLYTSPHLCRFAERIRLGGEPIGDERLAAVLSRVLREAPELSFFEVATLSALLAFREAEVDVAVLEVGIGGRLDATNVLPSPAATAITRVALDHTDRLGPTLADIAREKAGIAKPGVDLFLGPMGPAERAVIAEVARAQGTPLQSTAPLAEGSWPVALAGEHQRANAGLAVAIAQHLGWSRGACARGLADVRWPGRLETLETPGGPVLLDAAHNPDGVAALARHLRSLGGPPPVVVFGALADKRWAEMLAQLGDAAFARVYAKPPVSSRGGVEPAVLAALHPGRCAASVGEALDVARGLAGQGGRVVVCGSIYLVGEARAILLDLPRDPPVAL